MNWQLISLILYVIGACAMMGLENAAELAGAVKWRGWGGLAQYWGGIILWPMVLPMLLAASLVWKIVKPWKG